MEKIHLENGEIIITKEATREDSSKVIDFYNVVGGETDFLSFGKDEFKRNPEDYGNYLEATKSEENSIILISTINDKIIAISTITSNQKAKSKHVGTLGIVISKDYCNKGIGEKLINFLIDFCKNNGVTKKISLVTNENNKRAIHLYEKLGFIQEGFLIKDNFVNGEYWNSVMMGLLL